MAPYFVITVEPLLMWPLDKTLVVLIGWFQVTILSLSELCDTKESYICLSVRWILPTLRECLFIHFQLQLTKKWPWYQAGHNLLLMGQSITATCRLWIQRYARLSLLVPHINNLGHMALLVNQIGKLTWSRSFDILFEHCFFPLYDNKSVLKAYFKTRIEEKLYPPV